MLPGYAVYDGTKGAVEQFTRILSKESAYAASQCRPPGSTSPRSAPFRCSVPGW